MAYTTIDKPTDYFDTKLHTGTGLSKTLAFDFEVDFLWTKMRNDAYSQGIYDSSRGNNSQLRANVNNSERGAANTVSFGNSSGVTLGSDSSSYGVNQENTDGGSAANYVAWAWKANGGTTTTNDASSTGVGSVDSVYQVNSTAKFGLMTYTATGSGNITVAHGMGSAPKFLITKVRDQNFDWFVWHHTLANTHGLGLNTTNASADSSDALGDTSPSSTVFTMGNGGNANNNYQAGDDIICYYFDEVQGYSKFGSYTGNGTSSSADFDGPFVYTGFKPAWIMTKRSSTSNGSWAIVDNKRDTANPTQIALFANTTGSDDTDKKVDFLSNGFKLRNSRDDFNTDGVTYIYIAFAEHPFVSSKGVPVTAK